MGQGHLDLQERLLLLDLLGRHHLRRSRRLLRLRLLPLRWPRVPAQQAMGQEEAGRDRGLISWHRYTKTRGSPQVVGSCGFPPTCYVYAVVLSFISSHHHYFIRYTHIACVDNPRFFSSTCKTSSSGLSLDLSLLPVIIRQCTMSFRDVDHDGQVDTCDRQK